MDMKEMQKKAKEAREAKKLAGIPVVILTPTEKARADPRSMRKAITAFCFECMGGTGMPSVRQEVANCTAPQCSLYPLRPWQRHCNS
jgi:hypothetical protein